MQTQVIISMIATLALIGLALASLVAEVDHAAEAHATPDREIAQPAGG